MFIQNTETGRSMVEMLGVLLIMGVITAAAITLTNAAWRSQKRTSTLDEIAFITSGIRQQHGHFDDFTGIDNNTIFAAIGVSNRNQFNGRYEISINPANRRQFIITMTGLNTSDCEFFRTRAWIDSAEFRRTNGRVGGATATPGNCSDNNGNNNIHIVFGE